jgi:hypothetical protein
MRAVTGARELRAGARSYAAGDLPAIDDDNPPALDRELLSGGNACDTRADDDDVALSIALQGNAVGGDIDLHPERFTAAVK